MDRRQFLQHAALGLVGFAASRHVFGASKNASPNILVIVTDDQGYGDLSAFNHHASDVHTPNIDRLAAEGTLFTQAYVTAPVCSPSRAGWNTGKYQFRWDEKASWAPGLPDKVKNIAEYMRDAGYATARVGKNDYGANYHSSEGQEYPLNHGYEEFLGFNAHAHDYWHLSEDMARRTPDPNGHSAHLGPLMCNNGYKSIEDEYITDVFTDAAVEFIQRERNKPFFLSLSYNAVHHLIHEVPQRYLDKYGVKEIPDYDPETQEAFERDKAGTYSAYYEKYSRLGAINSEDMRKFYLANLNCLDDNVGRVLDALDASGLADNTLVLFFSDNGGSPITGACNKPLTGSKYALHEGGIRVPFIMRYPGVAPAGQVVTAPVSSLDILPTCAAVAGITLDDPHLDGISLLPLVTGTNPDAGKDRLFVWRWQDTFAVRRGDWKITNVNKIWYKGGEASHLHIAPHFKTKKDRLFNLKDDPGETRDCTDEYPEIAKQLKQEYETWCKENTGVY